MTPYCNPTLGVLLRQAHLRWAHRRDALSILTAERRAVRGGGFGGGEDGDEGRGSVQRVTGENEHESVVNELLAPSLQVPQTLHPHLTKLPSSSRWSRSPLSKAFSVAILLTDLQVSSIYTNIPT
ncbi:hypothetical protein Fmac_000612 [Flemingia macrophylla]|uniref:Uncharacterized protein n=1 Tax=Flemingia macrophylla TaxID=520843 RepID=A0ABD1NEQ7_9FABA